MMIDKDKLLDWLKAAYEHCYKIAASEDYSLINRYKYEVEANHYDAFIALINDGEFDIPNEEKGLNK